jgi:hypothetical protein
MSLKTYLMRSNLFGSLATGIKANEIADKLANQATNNPYIDIELSLEIVEVTDLIRHKIDEIFQKTWSATLITKLYILLSLATFLFLQDLQKNESLITRLRLAIETSTTI